MRIVGADSEICVIIAIRMDYYGFFWGVAVRLRGTPIDTNFILSPPLLLELVSLLLDPLEQGVAEAEEAAPADDGANYNRDLLVATDVIATITIAVTITSVTAAS